MGAIPEVYTEGQTVRILGEDEKETIGRVAGRNEGSEPKRGIYSLLNGKYDVDVKSGPSHATQREEARETMMNLIQHLPNVAPVVVPKLLDLLEIDGADTLARQMAGMLPEHLRQIEEAGLEDMGEDELRSTIAQLMAELNDMKQQVKDAAGFEAQQEAEQAMHASEQETKVQVATIQAASRLGVEGLK